MHGRFEYQGNWWIPVSEDKWSGKLTYDPERGVELDIVIPDQFLVPFADSIPNVYGRTVDKYVTLEDVDLRPSMTIPGGTEATLRPRRTYVGPLFNPGEEIAFDRLTVRIEGLDEWASASGFEHTTTPPDRFSVFYEVPDAVEIATSEDLTLRLSFLAHSRPRGMPVTAFDLEQVSRIELLADKPQPYEALEELVGKVRNFLMFVARKRVGVLSLKGELEFESQEASRRERGDVEIYTRAYGANAHDQPRLLPLEFLFTARENDVGADSRLSRWLALSADDDLGPVFNLYLVGLYQPRIFLEYRFLSLSQAAESLHAHRFESKLVPTADHNATVAAVLDALTDDDLKNWVRVRLADANRKRFRKLLAELIDSLPPKIRCVLPDGDLFAQKVMFTRHYHTHPNPGIERKAATTVEELFGLTRALRCVLEALLLVELGFSSDETEELLDRNLKYMRELRTGLDAVDFSVLYPAS